MYIGIQTIYMVEAHLTAITALSLLGYDATSLAHLYLGSLSHSSQALSCWMGSIAAQPFSGLSRDVRLGSNSGSGWAIQGHCPEATSALSWLCAWGRCPVGRWTVAPFWGPEHSGTGFYKISLDFAPIIFPSILTSLPVPAAEKHPHSMMLPPPVSP